MVGLSVLYKSLHPHIHVVRIMLWEVGICAYIAARIRAWCSVEDHTTLQVHTYSGTSDSGLSQTRTQYAQQTSLHRTRLKVPV